MNPSVNILKIILDFTIKISESHSLTHSLTHSLPEVRPHFVKIGQAPFLSYAGRSPPLRYMESVRRFCFPDHENGRLG